MKKFKGLMAAPFTPLDEKGELNLETVEILVELYARNKVMGAFICGTTGEGVQLSLEENKQLIKKWGSLKSPDLIIIAMVGGTCLKDMQYLAHYARDHQMDGIAIVSPYYFKPKSVQQLVSFCGEVAAVVPDVPCWFYHIPGLSGGYFPMLEFLKLAENQIPSLAGIKFSAMDIFDFHATSRFKPEKYELLWGTDEALLSVLPLGANGAVGSTYNYAAPLYHRMLAAYEDGDMAAAEHWQYLSVQMVQLLIKYGGVGAGKAFMKLIGVDCGWFRAPIQPLSSAQMKALQKELEELGFFEFCNKV